MEADTQGALNTDPDAVRGGKLSVMEYATSRPLGVARVERAIGKSEVTDQSHLCRRFRETIGVPPSVFRRQYR